MGNMWHAYACGEMKNINKILVGKIYLGRSRLKCDESI
jgi:hypothetical protein